VHYNAIYLSPHFDDAALSCGGQIYDMTSNGQTVLVVTIMAGVPPPDPASQFVETLHERWQLKQDAVETRQEEDIAACKVLGADWQHWDFLDCIYRVEVGTKRPLYCSDADIFGEIDPAESGLISQIAEKMTALPACHKRYIPLTLGHHVDHQLTRLAAEQGIPTATSRYSEDYPYARQTSAKQFIANEPDAWQPEIIKITDSAVAARINAISCFQSQLSSFFQNQLDLEKQVSGYINSVGGERVWLRTESQ
jgi:LmbE family N-acetylglucosaminyl deacetylase